MTGAGNSPECRWADGEAVVKVLRGSHGDVAGAESGASSVERSISEHGNRPWSALWSTSPTWPPGLGTPSADRSGTGRSRRSSPRPGEPVTWRRTAVVSRRDWRLQCRETRYRMVTPGRDGGYRRCRPTFTVGRGRFWSPVRRPVPKPGCRAPEQTHGRDHGEPVAWRHARRVRRAAWGNGPAAMPAPRPRPTHPSRRRSPSPDECCPSRRRRWRYAVHF